ncbi:hypothetical protein E2562_036609 [Oryza meyeriana var. granulata]|uniref:Uncharacterized protein n=1 Tax=Oryza meyeriana var. granulata TaxID=110450 RepID=A0A6G1D9Q3_9ORYZ|nr:hypothetical protein E2562_036609 [Oryza meyeriana var. granulata]
MEEEMMKQVPMFTKTRPEALRVSRTLPLSASSSRSQLLASSAAPPPHHRPVLLGCLLAAGRRCWASSSPRYCVPLSPPPSPSRSSTKSTGRPAREEKAAPEGKKEKAGSRETTPRLLLWI